MTTQTLQRVGGLVLALGGALSVLCILYGDIAYEGLRPMYTDDALWGPVNWVSLIAGILLVLGFTALYGQTWRDLGEIGLCGFGLSAASGMMFGVGFGAIFTVAVPMMDAADRAKWDLGGGVQPAAGLAAFFLVATMLFVVGFACWGRAAMRAHALPAWGSGGMLLSAALVVILTVIRLVIPTLPAVVGDVGFTLLFVDATALGALMYSGSPSLAMARA